MNNIVRDALVDVIIEQLGLLNITDKLNLSDVRTMADEMIVEDILIKDMLDAILKKIKEVMASKERWIHCATCGNKISLGDDMFAKDNNYFDTFPCLLEFVGAHETVLEPCFFDNDKEEE